MDALLPAAFALGFLSGFKHAFEPDHVLAVSTLLHREPRPARALRTGLAWGAGHTTMLLVAVVLIGLLRIQVSEAHLGYFELPVALMLVALGGWALYDVRQSVQRLRIHRHDGITHYHVGASVHFHSSMPARSGWQGYSVGLVHGLAGSGALLLVTAAALPSLAASLCYALLFGVGSILGMGAVTLALAMPLLASHRRPTLYHTLTGLSGTLSILLGASILYALWG